MIYVIKLTKTNFIKVGYTTNISGRLTAYKNTIPNEMIEFFIAKEGTRDDENYYRDKYRAYKTKSNSEWLKLPDELIIELLSDFNSGNNIKINKQSKKEWYNENIDKLVELCLSGVSLNKAAIQLNVLNWDWIKYANLRYEKETGKRLTEIWARKGCHLSAEFISNKIKELYNQGLTVEEISEEVNRSINIVNKYIKLSKIHS